MPTVFPTHKETDQREHPQRRKAALVAGSRHSLSPPPRAAATQLRQRSPPRPPAERPRRPAAAATTGRRCHHDRRRRSRARCRAAARPSRWPYQQEAIDAFQKANSGTTITYGGGGSGKGRTDLKNKVVDFAGSDSPYADADKPAEPILYFPILLGPITVSYNLSGVDKLQLSPDTIAKIFQRPDHQTWNDPAIAADNPGVTLPRPTITVAHRSDGSGTTQNFTE